MPPNPDNLIPLNKRTKEEQREIASKGGKASGKARRRKANAKKAVELFCSLPLKEGTLDNLNDLKSLSEINEANLTFFELAVINQLKIASQGDGTQSTQAFKEILKLLGQYPKEEAEDVTINVTWGDLSGKED